MKFTHYIKRFQRASARYGLFVFYSLFSILPYRVVRWITHVLIAVGFSLVRKQRRVAVQSLTKAFGRKKTPEEINQIMRKCFLNLGQGLIEMIYYLSHPLLVKEKVVYEGKEHLDEALSKGRGVVAVTAHFGNFPLMMLSCAVGGYKTSAIVRSMRDTKVEDFLLKKRSQLGLNTIYAVPRRKCVTDSLKVLRNNEILFIPLDQNFGSGSGVFVDFFGQKAATATGPVVFASRTKAAILPMFIIREDDDTHRVIIESPIELEDDGDDEKTVFINTAKITKLIEDYIRQYPHEWGWMHRRWKSRPYETKFLPNA